MEAKQRVCRVILDYQSPYTDPLIFLAGEGLVIGKEKSEWDGWVWCTNKNEESRWVPEAYVERKGKVGVMHCDYEATELSVSVGEELVMDKEESDWIWCTNQSGQSGWVPADHVERMGDE